MFKKAALNLMYNFGMGGSIIVGYLAIERKSFLLIFPAIAALIFFLMQKIKLMKEIKSMKDPRPAATQKIKTK
ncbi:DUF6358 family protein [Mucilaginibacter sp.]